MRRQPMSKRRLFELTLDHGAAPLFDCCQNNDGAACIIVTSAERAKDCKQKPAYISGFQGVHAGRQQHNFTLPGLGVAQQDVFPFIPTKEDMSVYDMAGIDRSDVDMLMTYDAFSPTVLFVLERFGFCKPGEALEFVKDGRIGIGGELPMNTSGGVAGRGGPRFRDGICSPNACGNFAANCGARQGEGLRSGPVRQLPRRIHHLPELRRST